ncbi:MAG: PASTA domain-containing protein [Gaiellaceae bacterium]
MTPPTPSQPPPPPEEDPTVVTPAGRRQVVDEEYVEGPPPPVVRPYPWWLWVLAGIFLALAILFAVLWWMERNDTNDVPSLVGLSAAQARDKASADGFTLETLSRPSGQPAGTVIDQAPQAGAGLESGAQVMAVVSGGQAQATVPKLTGSTATAAEQLLESQGLQSTTRSVDSTKPKGIVVAQDPPEGTKVAKGTSVGLAVSSGQGTVKVPGVQGTSQADAVSAITKAGLVPVVIQVPSQQAEGNVIAQDPAPNQQVRAGSKVRINVSGGPASTQTQTVTTSETQTTTTATTVTTTTP